MDLRSAQFVSRFGRTVVESYGIVGYFYKSLFHGTCLSSEVLGLVPPWIIFF